MVAFPDALVDILWEEDLGPQKIFKPRLARMVFADTHLLLAISTKIEDVLVVDLQVSDTHNELSFTALKDVAKNIGHRHLHNAIVTLAITLHGECLARGCLAIGKYRSVHAVTEGADHITNASLVHSASLSLWPENMIEGHLLASLLIHNAILSSKPGNTSRLDGPEGASRTALPLGWLGGPQANCHSDLPGLSCAGCSLSAEAAANTTSIWRARPPRVQHLLH
jgi:hypothetical protein